MAHKKLDPQIKLAVLNLTAEKKDKLLLRLLQKEPLLVKQLTFELLEDGQTTDERAEAIRDKMDKILSVSTKSMTPGWLLMEFRGCNPLITEHVKITKDKLGEVILTIFMLQTGLDRQDTMLKKMPNRMETLAPYVVRRVQTVLKIAEKLHEDLHLEFRSSLNRLLGQVFSHPPMAEIAREEGLPIRWG